MLTHSVRQLQLVPSFAQKGPAVAHDANTLTGLFLSRLAESWPPVRWQDVTMVAAVSGGADSIALVHSLLALSSDPSNRLVVAHVNHGLRGSESDRDERFVADLCARLGVPCEIRRIDATVFRKTGGRGIEAVARHARYECLKAIAAERGVRHVATGHTADDQAETILQRVLRGTGLRGLGGIPPVRSLSPGIALVRPMLGFRREEILTFLAALGEPYREDSTNRDPRFRRNRIRRELLPLLIRDYNPNLPDALIRLGRLAGQTQSLVDRLVERLMDRAVRFIDQAEVDLDCSVLSQEHPLLVQELLQQVWISQRWPLAK